MKSTNLIQNFAHNFYKKKMTLILISSSRSLSYKTRSCKITLKLSYIHKTIKYMPFVCLCKLRQRNKKIYIFVRITCGRHNKINLNTINNVMFPNFRTYQEWARNRMQYHNISIFRTTQKQVLNMVPVLTRRYTT